MSSVDGSGAAFPALKNDLLLRAAWGEDVERVPVWVMRQAGRYLPEFREIRNKHEFFEICQDPALACEVTMQPIKRFNLDAAIIFNDILVIPQALGMQVEIKSKIGVSLPDHFKAPEEIFRLKWPNQGEHMEGLQHVYNAITYTRFKLDGKVPLIGFSGGPWTLMTYMVEGGGSNTMSNAKKWLYQSPECSDKLLDMLTTVIIDYLLGQVKAGAQALQVFESNLGYLTPKLFNEVVMPALKRISSTVTNILKIRNLKVPLIIFCKGAHYAIDKLGDLGYDVVSLDWTVSPAVARRQIDGVTLQGNLDPCALYGDPNSIRRQVTEMVHEFGTKRYIANLGHGIYPDTDPEHVAVFIDSVRNACKRY